MYIGTEFSRGANISVPREPRSYGSCTFMFDRGSHPDYPRSRVYTIWTVGQPSTEAEQKNEATRADANRKLTPNPYLLGVNELFGQFVACMRKGIPMKLKSE